MGAKLRLASPSPSLLRRAATEVHCEWSSKRAMQCSMRGEVVAREKQSARKINWTGRTDADARANLRRSRVASRHTAQRQTVPLLKDDSLAN